jgi:hypothetical protein
MVLSAVIWSRFTAPRIHEVEFSFRFPTALFAGGWVGFGRGDAVSM